MWKILENFSLRLQLNYGFSPTDFATLIPFRQNRRKICNYGLQPDQSVTTDCTYSYDVSP